MRFLLYLIRVVLGFLLGRGDPQNSWNSNDDPGGNFFQPTRSPLPLSHNVVSETTVRPLQSPIPVQQFVKEEPTIFERFKPTPMPFNAVPPSTPVPVPVPFPVLDPAPILIPDRTEEPFKYPTVTFTPTSKPFLELDKSFGQECDLKCTIPIKIEYVCGTNGVTYFNRDELRCAKRLCFPDLNLAYEGKCKENRVNEDVPKETESFTAKTVTKITTVTTFPLLDSMRNQVLGYGREKLPFEDTNSILETVSDTESPTISSNNYDRVYNYDDIELDIKTGVDQNENDYGLDFEMGNRAGFPTKKLTQKQKYIQEFLEANPYRYPDSIQSKKKGKKKGKSKWKIPGRINPIKNSKGIECDVDQCSCPYDLIYVCGTDGITYGNECVLKCMQACDPDLKKYYKGACRPEGIWGGIINPRLGQR